MRKYTNIEKFLDDAVLFNLENNNVVTILDAELAKEFLSRLTEQYMIQPQLKFHNEFEDGDIFAIDKYENEKHDIYIHIYNIYNEYGELANLNNDSIFIQKGVLEEIEIDTIEFSEEMILADIDEVEEYDFEIEDEDFEEDECKCGNDEIEDEEDIELYEILNWLIKQASNINITINEEIKKNNNIVASEIMKQIKRIGGKY